MTIDIFPDKNVGPAELRGVHGVTQHELLVRKIFGPTFQGEMPFAGTAAIFVRLAGCNRGAKGPNCGVACDTDFLVKRSTLYDAEALANTVKSLAYDEGVKLVVITGGEPLMQPAVAALCRFLLDEDFTVQIESNGDFHLDLPDEVHVVISPKAHGLKPHGPVIEDEVRSSYYDKNELFPKMNYHGRIKAFRFVVHYAWDHPHYLPPEQMINWSIKFNTPIYLSPMTIYNNALGVERLEKILTQTSSIGWPQEPLKDSILDYEATAMNYHAAVQLAFRLRRKGFDVGLSMQTHLWMGVE